MSSESKRTLTLQVAGRSYRVATTASEEEVRRLASVVDVRTQELFRGRPVSGDALVLTAISLAHDAERERLGADAFRAQLRAQMARLLEEIDTALAQLPSGRPRSGADPER